MILAVDDMVAQLGEVMGKSLVYDAGGCDLVVGERLLVLRYRPLEHAWYAVGVLGPLKPIGHPLRMEAMKKALEANFLGRHTMGMQISLFAETFLIADRVDAVNLTALEFATRLKTMSNNVAKILADWVAQHPEAENSTMRIEG